MKVPLSAQFAKECEGKIVSASMYCTQWARLLLAPLMMMIHKQSALCWASLDDYKTMLLVQQTSLYSWNQISDETPERIFSQEMLHDQQLHA